MENAKVDREKRSSEEDKVAVLFRTMAASDKNARCKLPDIAAQLLHDALTQLPAKVLDHKVTPLTTNTEKVPLRELLSAARAAVTAWHQKMHDDAAPTEVATFAHCGSCLRELPDDQSPHEYARLEVGIHSNGTVIDVMCTRHNERVVRLPLATAISGHPEWQPRWAVHTETIQ
jgi:hypothetical protein